jgi:hypothetical protein
MVGAEPYSNAPPSPDITTGNCGGESCINGDPAPPAAADSGEDGRSGETDAPNSDPPNANSEDSGSVSEGLETSSMPCSCSREIG